MPYVNPKELYYQQFLSRENSTRHHKYDEELCIYIMVRSGNLEAIEENSRMFVSALVGHLSDNALQDKKYLFVASTTLATRFSIEGGLDEEIAYTASDLYIQKVDLCRNVTEVVTLYKDMLTYFTTQMAELKKNPRYSKPILLCTDYVYYHLHETIKVKTLANHVKMNANYLSELFKNETGQTLSAYITGRRIEAAKNMLLYSDTTYAEIAQILAFSSQSYFIRVFRKICGVTPKEFKMNHHESGFISNLRAHEID